MFVTDKFMLTNNQTVILSDFYQETKATNLGTEQTDLQQSDDDVNWETLASLNTNQTTVINPTKKYLRITSDTLVYVQSKTNDLTHPTASAIVDTKIADVVKLIPDIAPINQTLITKADTTYVNAEIAKAFTALINGADASADTLKELADKITALAQADTGLVSINPQSFTSEQKQQACSNIDALSLTQGTNLIKVNLTPLSNLIENHTAQIQEQQQILQTKADSTTVQSNQNTLISEIDTLKDELKAVAVEVATYIQEVKDATLSIAGVNAKHHWQLLTNVTDLNNLTQTGKYFIKHSSNPNAPVKNWLFVEVANAIKDRIKQTVTQDNDVTKQWVRHCLDGKWGDWYLITQPHINNRPIKYKELTGTFSGTYITIPHGLDKNNILDVSVRIQAKNGAIIFDIWDNNYGFKYYVDDTNVNIDRIANNSRELIGGLIKVFITHY